MKSDWQEIGLAWLRILVGIGATTHGFGKIFGGQMDGFALMVGQLGFPLPFVFAWAAALSEFLGGICLIMGIGTRLAAGFVFFTMSVALFLHHRRDTFHMKELAYLYWTTTGALVMLGSGRYSLARLLTKRR